MQTTISNEFLTVTIDTHGAEVVSVKNSKGEELIWQADPAIWDRHSPVLFPWAGRLANGELVHNGKHYSGGQHGFIRDLEHILKQNNGISAQLMFRADEESPIILDCLPHGLLSGKSFYQWKNTQAIPLTDTLFDNDSFCLAGLRSKTIGIYEKNSERKIICDISEYPYTLLWSAPTKPMRFICIEPWQSLPAAETDTSEWNEHAAAACIAPNESYSITLHTTFER